MYQTISVPRPEVVVKAIMENNEVIISRYYYYLKNKTHCGRLRKQYDSSLFSQSFDEVFNEAFLKLLEKIKSPGFVNHNLDGFAYRIIHGKTRDELKKQIRKRHIEAFDVQKHDQQDTSPTYTNAKQWVEDSTVAGLQKWYQTLDQIERQIIELRFQDFEHQEIAQKLELSPGTVRNKYSTLIRRAQKMIAFKS